MNDTFLRFFVDRISPMSCFRLSKWNRPGPRQNGPPLSLLRQTRRCLWSLIEIVWKLEGDLAINATHFANANRFLIIRISLTRHCANRRIFLLSHHLICYKCSVLSNKFSFRDRGMDLKVCLLFVISNDTASAGFSSQTNRPICLCLITFPFYRYA